MLLFAEGATMQKGRIWKVRKEMRKQLRNKRPKQENNIPKLESSNKLPLICSTQ